MKSGVRCFRFLRRAQLIHSVDEKGQNSVGFLWLNILKTLIKIELFCLTEVK